MRMTDSQLERIEYAEEEIEDLADLLQRIIGENCDGTVEELRNLGTVWEMALEIGKRLKTLRRKDL